MIIFRSCHFLLCSGKKIFVKKLSENTPNSPKSNSLFIMHNRKRPQYDFYREVKQQKNVISLDNLSETIRNFQS